MTEIDALLKEDRQFEPPAEWRQRANISDPSIYERAQADPEAFWAGFASELEWMRPWKHVLRSNPPNAEWFVGGQLNVSANCLDRHVRTARRNKAGSTPAAANRGSASAIDAGWGGACRSS